MCTGICIRTMRTRINKIAECRLLIADNCGLVMVGNQISVDATLQLYESGIMSKRPMEKSTDSEK